MKTSTVKNFGLVNLGDTSFFNAALQALLSIPEIKFYICNPDLWKNKFITNITYDSNKSLICSLYVLLKKLYLPDNNIQTSHPNINPLLIFNSVCEHTEFYKNKNDKIYSYFRTDTPNDAFKMFNAFINILHYETKEKDNNVLIKNPIFNKLDLIYHNYDLNNFDIPYKYEEILYFEYRYLQKLYSKEYSKLTSIFTSVILNTSVCVIKECNKKTFDITSSNVYELNLIDANITDKYKMHELTDYMNNQLIISKFTENNFHRRETQHITCYNYHYFLRIPRILIIKLNRFIKNGDTTEKLNYPINIPKKLDLSPCVYPDVRENCKNTVYQLISTVQYDGCISKDYFIGYFYTYSLKGDIWFKLNDSKVKPIKDPNNSQSYFVIYRRIVS